VARRRKSAGRVAYAACSAVQAMLHNHHPLATRAGSVNHLNQPRLAGVSRRRRLVFGFPADSAPEWFERHGGVN